MRSSYMTCHIQPFSQKSRTPTVAKEFQIGLYDPAEADLELFLQQLECGIFGRTAVTGGFSLPDGARERSIQLFADDRVARGHLIGQILQMWRRSQQQSSNLDS